MNNDLISRQAAIDAIVGMTTMGVEELANAGNKERFDWIKGLSDSLVKIINLPSVQPVVRCKDCKYYGYNECLHDLGLVKARDNNFCSYAERRTDA